MHIAALQYLFIPNCGKHQDSEGERELKVGGLNEKLDELVRAEGDAKAGVLQWLIRHTSPRLMRWILRIILKDMKVPSSLLSRTRTSLLKASPSHPQVQNIPGTEHPRYRTSQVQNIP